MYHEIVTIEQIEKALADGWSDDLYADYIMEHAPGDRIIANGDMLIEAMEDGYLFEDFADEMLRRVTEDGYPFPANYM